VRVYACAAAQVAHVVGLPDAAKRPGFRAAGTPGRRVEHWAFLEREGFAGRVLTTSPEGGLAFLSGAIVALVFEAAVATGDWALAARLRAAGPKAGGTLAVLLAWWPLVLARAVDWDEPGAAALLAELGNPAAPCQLPAAAAQEPFILHKLRAMRAAARAGDLARSAVARRRLLLGCGELPDPPWPRSLWDDAAE